MSELEQFLEGLVRRVVREELATVKPAPAATGMVTVQEYADAHALCEATVRAAFRDGRLDGIRIGKRAIRIRRDATIGQPASGRAAPGAETPAAIANRILARLR